MLLRKFVLPCCFPSGFEAVFKIFFWGHRLGAATASLPVFYLFSSRRPVIGQKDETLHQQTAFYPEAAELTLGQRWTDTHNKSPQHDVKYRYSNPHQHIFIFILIPIFCNYNEQNKTNNILLFSRHRSLWKIIPQKIRYFFTKAEMNELAATFISVSEIILQVNVKSRCEQTSFPLNYASAARGHLSLISVIQQSCF